MPSNDVHSEELRNLTNEIYHKIIRKHTVHGDVFHDVEQLIYTHTVNAVREARISEQKITRLFDSYEEAGEYQFNRIQSLKEGKE